MRLAVSQILKRSAAVALPACLAASMAFAQVDPGNKPVQRNNPGPPTQNVLVVNGSGQPVPTAAQGTTNVAGTVNVGNTPNVNVANMPNVNIANMPSVNIAGTPTVNLAAGGSVSVTNPLDGQSNAVPLAVTEGAQFFSDQCQIYFHGNYFGTCNFQTVPSGKLLVIQEFDGFGPVETGFKLININLFDSITTHYFPDTLMGTSANYDFFATHQPTRMYVNQGHTPVCGVSTSNNGGSNGYFYCQLSGFLVDRP